MNINEINDKSMEVLESIIDPFFELLKDKEFAKLYITNATDAVKYACKVHPKEAIAIAAGLKGQSVDEYVVDPFLMPLTILTAMAAYKKMADSLFSSQIQSMDETSSGSATENTEAVVQPINS